MSTILLVDDDKALCRSLAIQLQLHHHETRSAHTVEEGLALARKCTPDLLLLDINLPDQDGINALPDFLNIHPKTPVIIMTAEPGNQLVVDAMSSGAIDYIRKPFDLENVLQALKDFAYTNSFEHPPESKEEPVLDTALFDMVGSDSQMMEVHKTIGLLARSKLTVLVQGESGTGKELAARILHNASTPDKPFIAVNCSAVVPTLLESEFFGHEKGAFTGADKLKIGKLEYAGEGTVFFDEVGDMPMDIQAKLLRVLQEEEFVRVGGLEPIPLKARVVAATNHNLEQLVHDGKFRRDLFYRLAVSAIHLPPLRERSGDIRQLVEFLLRKISNKLQRPITSVSDDTMNQLKQYDWPGNVRELENVLSRAAALSSQTVLRKKDFEFPSGQSGRESDMDRDPLTLKEAEKQHIEKVLNINSWNISRTAQILDVSRTTLRKKINDYQLKK